MANYYRTLELIGDAAFDQRLYTIAAKKYTEANNKIKAMKALMKSGDTQRVIFFTNIQKQRDTYIMAANYLQSLDWRKDPEIMKNIITFYTRAKSMISLASFYEACAQVEIDEFQDYNKALSALAEAYKYLCRGGAESEDSAMRADEMINNLKFKVTVMRKFMEARQKLSQNAAEEGLRDLQQILQVENVNSAIRVGDVYALLIEYHANRQRWKAAHTILQEMRAHVPESSIRYYLNTNLLIAIQRELNIIRETSDETFKKKQKEEQRESFANQHNSDLDDIRDTVDYGRIDDYKNI